jgi:phage tail sheath gpL-like
MNFAQTPNRRIPFASIELDNSQAQGQSAAKLKYVALIIAQKLAAGPAAADLAYRVTNAEQAAALAGTNSMAHHAAQAWFDANKTTPLWLGLVADPGAGAQATATLTLAGTATAAGLLNIYIGGRVVRVPVAVGDTAAALAAAVVAALAAANLIVTGAAVGAVITFTCRHKGLTGNDLDLRLNYFDGEVTPAGITATPTAFTGGTSAPSLAALFAAVEEQTFHIVAHPYNDAPTMQVINTELDRRWGPTVQKAGQAVTAKPGSFSAVSTWGETSTLNAPTSTAFPSDASPTPPWEDAAATASVIAFDGELDPARPFQTLRVPWIKPSLTPNSRFTPDERDLLLYSGVATRRVGPDGVVQLERAITMYRKNASGGDDVSYLDLNTRLSLMYAINDLLTVIPQKYPRHKLGDDGVIYPPGEPIVTPTTIKGEALAWFDRMAGESPVVFDPATRDQFKNELIAERNGFVRVDLYVPPDLINQLLQTAVKLGFRL